MSFLVVTRSAEYRIGSGGQWNPIPDVKYVQWALYRRLWFPVPEDPEEGGRATDYTDPPRADDARAWGTLLTHDVDIVEELFDLTPRGLDPLVDPDQFPQLMIRYWDQNRQAKFKYMLPIIFCSYPGSSIFTTVGRESGYPQIQTIPFRIAMPTDGLIKDYIHTGWDT